MCGRFAQVTPAQGVAEAFDAEVVNDPGAQYNIAPAQEALVVRDGRLSPMRWGLIPHWAKDALTGAKTFNARAETAREKPAFRDAFVQGRCLVPADCFYEWNRRAAKSASRQPCRIHRRDGQWFVMAGLWAQWRDEERAIDSFTILTVPANGVMSELHDRMPAILAPEDWDAWFKPANLDYLASLLAPAPGDMLSISPANARLNRAGYDAPDCWDDLPPDGQISFL